jgi:hypothetical protein
LRRRILEEIHRFRDSITVPRRHIELLESAEALNPVHSPRHVRLGVDLPQRAERPLCLFSPDVVELSAGRLGEYEQGVPLVEGTDACARARTGTLPLFPSAPDVVEEDAQLFGLGAENAGRLLPKSGYRLIKGFL